MSAQTYTYTALWMRYVFIAAILYILLRLVLQALSEYREIQRVKKQVAGTYLRFLAFLDPAELRGVNYALQKENSLGSASRCDVCLAYRGIKRHHASIYQSGASEWLSVRSKRGVYYNGAPVKHHTTQLNDGDTVEIHGVRFAYKTRRREAAHE